MFSFKRKKTAPVTARTVVSPSELEYENSILGDSMFNEDPELLAHMINEAKRITETANVSYGGGGNDDAHDRMWEWAQQWMPSVRGLQLRTWGPAEGALVIELGSYVDGVGAKMLEPILGHLQAAVPSFDVEMVKDCPSNPSPGEYDYQFELTLDEDFWSVRAVAYDDCGEVAFEKVDAFKGSLDAAFKFTSDNRVADFA